VQTDIETMTAQQTRLNARVDTELLTIALDPYASVAAVASPLGQAWHDAGQALGESAASAFTFVIVALPWLPLVALTVFLLARLLRMVGRRRRTASVPAATATET
jgi:hypothetical protein